MANVTMRQMLEAGVHFGHQTRFWNPKMSPYIFGERGKIHIVNLEATLPLFNDAMNFIASLVANRGRIMFVGTKRAAQNVIRDEAIRCGMPYVNHRWLGGMLTNFKTVQQSIKRLKDLETMSSDGTFGKISKKEGLMMSREMAKLERSLGGIKDMQTLPDAMFVIDVGHEEIAVKEAVKLGVPVVGVVDTNNSIQGIDYVIPGNDDSIRAIQLYVHSAADAVRLGRTHLAQLPGESEDEFIELDDADAAGKSRNAPRAGTKKKPANPKPKAASQDDGAGTAEKPAEAAGDVPAEKTDAANPVSDTDAAGQATPDSGQLN